MKNMKIYDYCKNFDMNLILKDETGKTLVDTYESHGEIPFDAYDYNIVSIEAESQNCAVIIVRW